ncbi:hypothetical protein RST01_20840 [Rummeliibacillus stabekisii]|nr:hypothetical protein RST01_20840 [Rummeliibacillus stabekisii]
MKKVRIVLMVLLIMLVVSVIPKSSFAHGKYIKNPGSCTLVIDKNKHTGENGNFAEATGVCKGFEQGVYSKQGGQYAILGTITQQVKNGQKFKMSTPFTYGEATLTVYTTTKSPSVNKKSVKVLNSKGSKDNIVISKVQKNDVVNVYKDSKMKQLLYTTKAKSSSIEFKNKKLNKKGGYLYITLKRPYLKESIACTISYKAE